MMHQSSPRLPDGSSWSFEEIARTEPERARKLESTGSPTALLNSLVHALDRGINSSAVRIGREHADAHWDDCRAVVQFGVGADVFDWFFNARTGYRAHFRTDYIYGLEFNAQIIAVFHNRLARLPDFVCGREVDSKFEDAGAALLPRDFLLKSLVPNLSKVWFCTKRIRLYGGIQDLPLGIGGPKIILDGNIRWEAFYRESDFAWLDVKGAFLGKAGPYQPKDPVCRAKTLQTTGLA